MAVIAEASVMIFYLSQGIKLPDWLINITLLTGATLVGFIMLNNPSLLLAVISISILLVLGIGFGLVYLVFLVLIVSTIYNIYNRYHSNHHFSFTSKPL